MPQRVIVERYAPFIEAVTIFSEREVRYAVIADGEIRYNAAADPRTAPDDVWARLVAEQDAMARQCVREREYE